MKKLSILFFTLILSATLFSQTIFTFEYLGGAPIPCNPFVDEPYSFYTSWKVSHGTPTCGDAFNQNTYTDGKMQAKYDDTGAKGEGLFINFQFLSTHIYNISCSCSHYNGDPVKIEIYAANNIQENSNSDCDVGTVPIVGDKQQILASWINPDASGHFYQHSVSGWQPNKVYNQLWILSKQEYLNYEGTFLINNIQIEDLGEVTGGDTEAPSMPTNVQVLNITENSCLVTWNPATDNSGIVRYKVYKNGYLYESTSNTFCNISGLESCTEYSITVGAVDPDLNETYSLRKYFATKKELAETIYEENDFTLYPLFLLKQVVIEAKNSIVLSDGFKFIANDSYFIARTAQFGECEDVSKSNIEKSYVNNTNNKDIFKNKNLTQRTEISEYFGKKSFQVYPNPTSDIINVDIENYSNCSKIEIINLTGKVVASTDRILQHNQFDFSGFGKGFYFIRLYVRGDILFKKIVKQ